jgi:hypothetical protein
MVFPPDLPVPSTYDAALREMVDKAYLASQNWQRQQWRAERSGAHPDIVEFERVFIRRCKKLGIPLFAHSMVRSRHDQDKLFADGVTQAKGGESPHNYGLAVDIVHGVKAWGLSRREWDLLGHVGMEVAKSKGIGVAWGGNWPSFYDPAHWELTGWKRFMSDFPFPPLGG